MMAVFFLLPFAGRGARLAVEGMRNDVKDWLPKDFTETQELTWFRNYFLGEAFIMVSWDGCEGRPDDKRFRLFLDKFFPETPPSERRGQTSPAVTEKQGYVNEDLQLYARQMTVEESGADAGFVGDRLGLYCANDYKKNWGGRNEKWMRGIDDRWFYILPDGDIYQWNAGDTWWAFLKLGVKRVIAGRHELDGTFVATLGPIDGPWYYRDPRRLEARLFKSLQTGPAILSDLVKEGGTLEGNYAEAMRRLKGVLFGPDEKQTCLLLSLSEIGRQNLHRLVGRGIGGKPRGKVYQLAQDSGLQTPPVPSMLPPPFGKWMEEPPTSHGPIVRLGGPPVDNVAIDEEGQITLARLVWLSVILGIGISYFSFRSLAITIILFFVGGTSAIASLSFIGWTNIPLDAVLMSMPSLVYVLGLSGAVHIVNYYREAVANHGLPGSAEKALSQGWKPCTLAALTTALGLCSLGWSDIAPIKKFGMFSAMGVLFTLALMFTFLPAALHIWPPKRMRRDINPDDLTPNQPAKITSHWLSTFWHRVGQVVMRNHSSVAVVSMIVLVGCALGLARINTSVQLLKLFGPSAKILGDYKWLETNLGRLVPMELVVQISPNAMRTDELSDDPDAEPGLDDRFRLSFLERMEVTERVRKVIDAQYGTAGQEIVGRAMLASTFAPVLPKSGGGLLAGAKRGAISRQLVEYRDNFINESDYLRIAEEDDSELWRISLRLGALQDLDYGLFVGEIKNCVEPVLAAYHYRDHILRSIDERLEGQGFRNAKVLLLGAPLGQSSFASKRTASAEDAEAKEEAARRAEMSPEERRAELRKRRLNQPAIFASTLRALMKNAALGAREWHDPKYELPPNWQEKLSGYDSIVLVQDDPRYDIGALEDVGPLFVDARGFHYDSKAGDKTAHQQNADISVVYTGLVPIIYKAQRTLLQNLIVSTGWAFAAISVVMIALLRSLRAGMLSMIPNFFPVAVIFGLMGWMNILVDIGTMMTASVAMGVAVDDTIHFLTWFRKGLDEGRSRKASIMLAYDRCAAAMTQTTLIAGVGLSVFALSTFTPTQRFGILMLTLMTAALIGDLIFLPALLAGPLGRAFREKIVIRPTERSLDTPSENRRLHRHGSVAESVRRDQPH